MYPPLIWTSKVALLLQLMRIFVPSHRGSVYWIIHALIWGNFAFYLSAWFVTLFECIPMTKIWDPLEPGGRCINITGAQIATGAVNCASDILMLMLPLWAISHLHMAFRRKLGVLILFATGVM